MGTVRKLRQAEGVRLGGAVDAYLATIDHPESKGTHRVYAGVLAALRDRFGDDAGVAELAPAAVAEWFTSRWGVTAPSTWNVSRAALRSAAGWWTGQGWITSDPVRMIARRKTAPDRDRALSRAQVERLLTDEQIPLRQRLLWRMLYETAARSAELLALDVENLDLSNRRAQVRRKGGAIDVIVWQTGTARLLPRYLRGRKTGPLFVTERTTRLELSPADLDEHRHARLSYERAAQLFRDASKGATLAPIAALGIVPRRRGRHVDTDAHGPVRSHIGPSPGEVRPGVPRGAGPAPSRARPGAQRLRRRQQKARPAIAAAGPSCVAGSFLHSAEDGPAGSRRVLLGQLRRSLLQRRPDRSRIPGRHSRPDLGHARVRVAGQRHAALGRLSATQPGGTFVRPEDRQARGHDHRGVFHRLALEVDHDLACPADHRRRVIYDPRQSLPHQADFLNLLAAQFLGRAVLDRSFIHGPLRRLVGRRPVCETQFGRDLLIRPPLAGELGGTLITLDCLQAAPELAVTATREVSTVRRVHGFHGPMMPDR